MRRELSPIVRAAVREDLEGVMAIEEAAFPGPWSRQTMSKQFENLFSLFLVAECPQGICGFALWWLIVDEMHLLKIAVDERYRRQGVGAELLAQGERSGRRRGARFEYLEVRTTNEAAIRFYEKFGFARVGTRRGYYAETGEDAYVLFRRFE
ncbi:ribosomal protein S18-alanine N-acetyltransferase [bacterium]|nr:ribosomal protein S18-alanine N-acetyltransferase [bacterium]